MLVDEFGQLGSARDKYALTRRRCEYALLRTGSIARVAVEPPAAWIFLISALS